MRYRADSGIPDASCWGLVADRDSRSSCDPIDEPAAAHLHVLASCRWYIGTVARIIAEQDGDHHVDVAPAKGFARFLDSDNYSEQHGQLVTEIMPGQRFPMPYIGERIALFGTWVYDSDHGWNEIHPIWAIRYLDTGRVVHSLPVVPPRYESDGGNEGGGGGGGGDLIRITRCRVAHA